MLEQIYSSHRQGLFSLALSITGCRQQAEDAIHSAFERLCRSTASPNGEPVNYVFAAVRNAARDAVQADRRVSKLRESIFNSHFDCPAAETAPADGLLTEERDQILRSAVENLDDDDREVVVLKVFAELTFDAIGAILNQPAKTLASRYRRALKKLEEQLRGQL
ncbi:MAG: sigma-70 family RNA polymerase sigma factor [Planctomycetaceae bacterium]